MQALNRHSVDAFKNLEKIPLVLILDNVRSGLNVGSVFRTADAFLVKKILLCGITAQPPHREILKTALGSTESVEWAYYESAVDAIQALQAQDYQVFAIEQTSDKIWLQDFEFAPGQGYGLVLGNEVEGVDEQAIAACNGVIEIPQFGTKHSLNVSVAAGIVIWQAAMGMLKNAI